MGEQMGIQIVGSDEELEQHAKDEHDKKMARTC